MAEEEAKVPAWLVTFSDLMTLLLTFFVLLLSMSTLDNKKKILALGSIRTAFGFVEGKKVPEDEETNTTLEHGVFTKDEAKDLFSNKVNNKMKTVSDIEFIVDRDVPIISLSDGLLFKRGEYILQEKGKRAIDRILPLLLEVKYPIKILGSASGLYDEFQIIEAKGLSPSWQLSLYRALAVYKYLKEIGFPLQKMLLEGVGEFNRLARDINSKEKLQKARRTDIVVDKRDIATMERIKNALSNTSNTSTTYKGFEFSVGS